MWHKTKDILLTASTEHTTQIELVNHYTTAKSFVIYQALLLWRTIPDGESTQWWSYSLHSRYWACEISFLTIIPRQRAQWPQLCFKKMNVSVEMFGIVSSNPEMQWGRSHTLVQMKIKANRSKVNDTTVICNKYKMM